MGPGDEIDYRFTLANERTFLAWMRTSLALVAGGIAAAKALTFHHEALRWVVAAPPLVGGMALAIQAIVRRRAYEASMRASAPLPVGRGLTMLGAAVCVYAVVALLATALDG